MRLRSALFMLVAGTMVPLLVLAFLLGNRLVETEKDAVRRGAHDRNRAFMTAVDAEVRGHISSLQAMTVTRTLVAGDLPGFREEMLSVMKTQPGWMVMILATPDGEQILNTRAPPGEKLPPAAQMDSIERAVTTRAPAVGGVTLGSGGKRYGVPLRVPVMKGERVAYVLTAVIEPNQFAGLIKQQNLPEGWVTGLVDATGSFIARIPHRDPGDRASAQFQQAIANAPEGWYRGKTVEGLDTYTAHLRSEYTNWSVGLALPAAVVDGAGNRAAWTMAIGTLITLGLALAFAWWMGRRISGPIGALAENAATPARLASRPVAPGLRITEVEELSRSLEDAGAAIRDRQALMEREQAALRAADKAKDEFLAMLGHELRNPLAAITTSAHVLNNSRPQEKIAEQARKVIERQTRHMSRLVEDLLDINRLTMGKVTLHPEPLELGELARRTVRTWVHAGREREGRVALMAGEAWVRGDRARLEQVLTNLLDNAEKFSPPGRPIEVRTALADREALLRVSDEGDGIAPELLPTIFELFVQGPQDQKGERAALARARGGMGLGLSIVRRVVDLHDGRISAASEGYGKGAQFTVRLPAIERPAERAAAVESAPAPEGAKRVLIVEDNDDTRAMLMLSLQMDGNLVRGASTGHDAVAEFHRFMPDLVLLDIGLPDIDGYEVARRIRQSGLNVEVKLVAITGYGQASDQQRAYDAGMDLHLTKPVPPEQLRNALASLA